MGKSIKRPKFCFICKTVQSVFCSPHSIWLDVGCFHLGQEVSRGELELILQVHLQQSIVVANIILCPWRRKRKNKNKIKNQNNLELLEHDVPLQKLEANTQRANMLNLLVDFDNVTVNHRLVF